MKQMFCIAVLLIHKQNTSIKYMYMVTFLSCNNYFATSSACFRLLSQLGEKSFPPFYVKIDCIVESQSLNLKTSRWLPAVSVRVNKKRFHIISFQNLTELFFSFFLHLLELVCCLDQFLKLPRNLAILPHTSPAHRKQCLDE